MKGVSDKDAQNDKKIKGNKKDLKKPIQVLHINKKDTISNSRRRKKLLMIIKIWKKKLQK